MKKKPLLYLLVICLFSSIVLSFNVVKYEDFNFIANGSQLANHGFINPSGYDNLVYCAVSDKLICYRDGSTATSVGIAFKSDNNFTDNGAPKNLTVRFKISSPLLSYPVDKNIYSRFAFNISNYLVDSGGVITYSLVPNSSSVFGNSSNWIISTTGGFNLINYYQLKNDYINVQVDYYLANYSTTQIYNPFGCVYVNGVGKCQAGATASPFTTFPSAININFGGGVYFYLDDLTIILYDKNETFINANQSLNFYSQDVDDFNIFLKNSKFRETNIFNKNETFYIFSDGVNTDSYFCGCEFKETSVFDEYFTDDIARIIEKYKTCDSSYINFYNNNYVLSFPFSCAPANFSFNFSRTSENILFSFEFSPSTNRQYFYFYDYAKKPVINISALYNITDGLFYLTLNNITYYINNFDFYANYKTDVFISQDGKFFIKLYDYNFLEDIKNKYYFSGTWPDKYGIDYFSYYNPNPNNEYITNFQVKTVNLDTLFLNYSSDNLKNCLQDNYGDFQVYCYFSHPLNYKTLNYYVNPVGITPSNSTFNSLINTIFPNDNFKIIMGIVIVFITTFLLVSSNIPNVAIIGVLNIVLLTIAFSLIGIFPFYLTFIFIFIASGIIVFFIGKMFRGGADE